MQDWTIQRTSSQSHLGVSLAEAKAHLRIGGTAKDDLITLLIESATEQLERDIARACLVATWKQSMSGFPSCDQPIQIMQSPVVAVTSVEYIDSEGATQTLDVADWSFSSARNSLYYEGSDGTWPSTSTETKSDKVFITFTAGLDDEGCVPRLMKQAILLEVGRAFFDPAQENGVNTNDGRSYENIVRKLRRTSYP